MQFEVAGKQVELADGASCADALKEGLSKKQFKKVVAAKCSDTILDLSATITGTCTTIEPVFEDSEEGLEIIRHSAAHLMAEAVKKLFPTAKVTIGPAIKDGFYYDFDFERPFTPEDMGAIEKEMLRSVGANKDFVRSTMKKDEAQKFFTDMGEDYKPEIMDDLGGDEFSIYTHGDFADLCRGPHVARTGQIKAFKLLSVAGAYWRGDENNKQLQRIYGTAWNDPKALKKHLHRLEEAKKRDHRKLGKQLDLFSFSDEIGPGMSLWHPRGMLLRTILEDFERKEHLKRGYDLVQGPLILKRELWEKSGHYDNYRENMYFTEIDDQAYGVKPMNCLAHMIIYKRKIMSYRDLPQRYFELGVVHRHEKSGVLHGLMRVRTFTQDDAHLICRPDQVEEEILDLIKFYQDIYALFDYDFDVELSTRPEKSIGTDEDWEVSTEGLRQALDKSGMEYQINEGDGAFYGPKIDFHLRDSIGRSWQCGTIQVDFTLPERFDIVYVGEDGERHRPVMIHRAMLGSIERFIGVLTEHCAGAYPVWLAPVQARLLNVTDAQLDFMKKAEVFFAAKGIRVDADRRNEKLGYKIREAQVEKIPYMLVVGDKEVEAGCVNIRFRDGEDPGMVTLEEAAQLILDAARAPFQAGGMRYSFSG